MTPSIVEKVTAFITRRSEHGHDLLLFEHPFAGVQIPAGTVKSAESPEQAVVREAAEETGLTLLPITRYLGCTETRLPEGHRIIAASTKVYARPDVMSFDWACLRQGITVTIERKAGEFSQVTYEEPDRATAPQYISMCITGWVPDGVLAGTRKRHFFHLEFHGHAEERWTVRADNHTFTLFWASLAALPEIIHPQDEWLEFLYEQFPLPTE